eukprot:CAMPEP_0172496826 /NCGR_PEP_ID=MMETSP1066-20121228/93702_1 /TAXON_ID=671091 /ORGANISM="Coscinodiscus wailesii, Strain CCMP2513" /LENGTH=73 /DNA_ID=CAMNT_0013269325 /DNA_START=71 /DNA_END=289 /DNA_ORIENTATION=+
MMYYYDYNSYDPYQQMAYDTASYQMYGYGGYGYETSHIPPDESHSPLYSRAEKGDLQRVTALVTEASENEKDN